MSWERDFVKVLLPVNLTWHANYHLSKNKSKTNKKYWCFMDCQLLIQCNGCNISTNFFAMMNQDGSSHQEYDILTPRFILLGFFISR
jgi:hypothetical protein